jgi:hypothetical protein
MVKRGEFLDTAWTQLVVTTAGRGAPREMLHRASTAGRVGGGALQQSAQLAGNGALETAADLALAPAWAMRRLV